MKNILVLINPYYESQVIEKHLEVLLNNQKAAFGKIKSKVNDNGLHPEQSELDEIYNTTSKENYLQLFITDYASIYVAKVTSVSDVASEDIKPLYYKDMDIEKWFIIEDIREVANNDFTKVRDEILPNFTTPQFGNHTFIVYGNRYHFPLIINQKSEIDYFSETSDDFKYCTNIFKTKEQLEVRENLIFYSIGAKRFNQLHPNTQDNLINAELEFKENCHNPLYDYTSVLLKYTKSFEYEIFQFFKVLYSFLIKKQPNLAHIPFTQNGINLTLSYITTTKASLGSYNFLLKNEQIKTEIDKHIKTFQLKKFIQNSISYSIKTVQNTRNENVHGKVASFEEVEELRSEMIGIGKAGMLVEIVKFKHKLLEEMTNQ